jgi:hypothetical protein
VVEVLVLGMHQILDLLIKELAAQEEGEVDPPGIVEFLVVLVVLVDYLMAKQELLV